MSGLENRTAGPDAPAGMGPTDPNLEVNDNTQGLDSESSPIVRVDASITDLTQLNGELNREIVVAQEMLARYIALEAWAGTVESITGYVPPEVQIGTELILGLTTNRTGMTTVDVVPSMEALSNGADTASAIRVYAKRLLEGLIRLGKKIAELFAKIYEILTSRCRNARLKVVAIKAKLALAKGGRPTNKHIGLGNYSRFLAIRGYAISSPGELYGALGAIGTLCAAATGSHLNALLWVGDELTKITNSESFPNPKATEARITRAFGELTKTMLSSECLRPIGSDPRFQSAGFQTTASENLLGNKTLYFTRPKEGAEIADTFGTVSYELSQSRLGDESYEAKAGARIETMDLGMARRLLELAEKQITVIETFDRTDPAKKLVSSMKSIHDASAARATKGGLDSTNAELLYSASVAYSAAAVSPIRDLLTHLSSSVDAVLDVIDRSVGNYD